MSRGITDSDAKAVARALIDALAADSSTAEKVQRSAAKILENSGSVVLGAKIASTPPDTWSSVWGSIKGFFAAIWEGISGAFEGLIDVIGDLF